MKNFPADWSWLERLAFVITFAAPAAVYVVTLSPSVGFIDSGELAAVVSTFGVAHPTGYPLFTLLGRVVSMLPLPLVPIQQLNLLSALLCSAASALGFLAFRTMLLGGAREAGRARATLAAAGGALVLAFSETFWSQALVLEVYSLHMLFLSTILYALARLREASERGDGSDGRWFAFGSYILGLSFGNHMTTVLLIPGLLYVYGSQYGRGAASIRGIFRIGLWTIAGLTVYAVLPIRASQGPTFSWGYVAEPERLWWHITGKQYSVWIFSSMDVAGRQLGYFLSSLLREFGYVGLALAVVGAVVLFARDRRLWIASVLFFVVCVAYAVNYDIHDIDSYFLLAYTVAALWSAFGIDSLAARLGRSPVAAVRIAGIVGALAVMIQVGLLWGDVSQRGKYVVEDYTKALMGGLPRDAAILSYQWDYWVSASYYYQSVERYRRDVAVIDKELLRRSWYLRELEGRYPWLIERSRNEVDGFLAEVYRFEHGMPYRGQVIQGHFVAMVRAMIQGAMKDRAVYVTREIEPEFTAGWQRVPEGLAFRLVADSGFVETPFPEFKYRPFSGGGIYGEQVRKLYTAAFLARAEYYQARGRVPEAARAREAAEVHASGRGGGVDVR